MTTATHTSAIRAVERPPIPFERVQQLVRDLLGDDDLTGIRGLTVHRDAVEVEVYAVDGQGRRFMRGDDVAVDLIHIPVT